MEFVYTNGMSKTKKKTTNDEEDDKSFSLLPFNCSGSLLSKQINRLSAICSLSQLDFGSLRTQYECTIVPF